MSLKESSIKAEEIEAVSKRCWDWIKQQPTYKEDFDRQEELRKLLKGSFVDYKLSDSVENFQNEMLKKWGFSPLVNPLEDDFPYGLDDFISQLNSFNAQVVKVCNESFLDYFLTVRKGKKPKKPEKLLVEIDYNFENGVICDELKNALNDFRHRYDIKVKRSRIDQDLLFASYKAFIQSKESKSKEELREKVFGKVREEAEESTKAKLYRILKKQQ